MAFDGEPTHGDRPERLPPSSVEAEQSVIGSVLLDRSLIGKLADVLRPEDFYLDRNGTIYAAMLALYDRQEPIDYLLLVHELERTGKLSIAGGQTYLGSLLGVVPTPIHAEHYARVVSSTATMRRLISAGSKIATIGFLNEHVDPAEAVEQAVGMVQEVLPSHGTRGPVALSDALSDYLDHLKEVRADTDGTAVPTGITDLDKILQGGMQRSDLIVIGARPSMGKTSMALNILRNVAARQGVGLMFSLEMPIDQIVGRLLSLESGVEATRIRGGQYTDVEVRRIGLAVNALAETFLHIDEENELTIVQIRERARRLHERQALDVIVVDHLQLIQASGRSRDQNRTEQVSEITRQLKAMARELKVPVLLLSQLNRAVENRASKVPELRDLRESGSSEQDADVVAFLYRDDYYDKESERQGLTDVIVAKHRNGPTGQLTLIFNSRTMQFLDVEPIYY